MLSAAEKEETEYRLREQIAGLEVLAKMRPIPEGPFLMSLGLVNALSCKLLGDKTTKEALDACQKIFDGNKGETLSVEEILTRAGVGRNGLQDGP